MHADAREWGGGIRRNEGKVTDSRIFWIFSRGPSTVVLRIEANLRGDVRPCADRWTVDRNRQTQYGTGLTHGHLTGGWQGPGSRGILRSEERRVGEECGSSAGT